MSLMRRLSAMLGGGEPGDGAPAPDSAAPVPRAQVAEALALLAAELHALDERAAALARIETAVAGLVPMVQFMAKANERSDRARAEQHTELRAHLTAETDRLASSLRLDAARAAALELFTQLLPAIDEIDDVLRAHGERADAPGLAALGSLRRRLRDTFDRLGIRELGAIERGAPFDPAIHEGVPCVDDGAAAGVPSGGVVALTRAGYRLGDHLIRAARVTVAP